MRINECNICKKKNIEKLSVNSMIELNSVEKKGTNGTANYQEQYYPNFAYLCLDCGHLEFFCE